MKKRRIRHLRFKVQRLIFDIKYQFKWIYRKLFVIPKGRKRPPMDLLWEGDYDFVEDKIIPNAMPRCPYCGEMPYSTEECVFCGQRFTEESAMQGNLPPEPIKYKSKNGYTGVLYGWHSFSIRDKRGKEVFHTGSRNINNYEELKEHIDGFPVFVANLHKHWEELENCEEDADI